MVKIDNIPVYNAVLAEDGGMMRISLVDVPAVMSNFQVFSRQDKLQRYRIQDEAQRRVFGVIMRADFPIYRRDDDGTEYYLIYRADTIKAMAEKYLVDGLQNNVNTMHRKGSDGEDVNMVQWFIKDTSRGIVPEGFDDIADGSLFAEFHVENDEVWEAIKDGTYQGFSLEGYFHFVPEQDTEDVKRIVRELDGKFSDEKPKRKHKMSKVKKLLKVLAAVLLGAVTTDKGILAWDGEDDLKYGDRVWIEDEDGNRTDPEDGDYRTDDRKIIRVASNVVTEIVDDEAEVSEGQAQDTEQMASVETDGGRLEWDGDDDLQAGINVYITDGDGNRVAAPDGEYRTEDGKVIRVEDGVVAEIRDDQAEVDEGRAQFNAHRVQMEATYDEIFNHIHDALVERGVRDFWIVDAGPDFTVVAVWDEESMSEKYFRYGLTTAEDGTVTLDEGEPVEVKQMFVPVDFVSPFDSNAESEVAQLRAEVERLKKRPAAEPAHTAFSQSMRKVRTGNQGLDRIAELMEA